MCVCYVYLCGHVGCVRVCVCVMGECASACVSTLSVPALHPEGCFQAGCGDAGLPSPSVHSAHLSNVPRGHWDPRPGHRHWARGLSP